MTLSETLVEPAYFTHPDYSETLGTEVADLARMVGFPPDPEQCLVLDPMFGLDPRGRRVAFEVAVIGARQNIKTGLFKIAALGEAFIAEVPLLVWSAHEFPTAQEAFRDLTELIESSPDLDTEVKHIHRGNGDEAIELLNGCRIKFKARTKAGGRGLSGKRVVLDEAFALQPAHMGALLPMLSAQDEPQVWYGSSAGLGDSDVLRSIRDRGRPGSRSMVYVEWCAPEGGCQNPRCEHAVGTEGCVLDDESRWQMANPQMGRRIKVDTIRGERLALPPAEFARERLGWWDDPDVVSAALPYGIWMDLANPKAERGNDPVFGLDVDQDRQGWIAVCWSTDSGCQVMLANDGDPVPAHQVVDECKRLSSEWNSPVVSSPLMFEELELADVNVVKASSLEFTASCGSLLDAVKASTIRHGNQVALNGAVKAARWRTAGTDGSRAFQLKDSPEVGPLAAVTRALHGWNQRTEYDVLDSIY